MEKTYFDEGGVLVTDKRFASGATMFPLSAIASIRLEKNLIKNKVTKWPLLPIYFGLMISIHYFAVESWFVATLWAFATVLGALWFARYAIKKTKPVAEYVIWISVGGGDKEGVVSSDLNFIEKVHVTLSEVLINRQ